MSFQELLQDHHADPREIELLRQFIDLADIPVSRLPAIHETARQQVQAMEARLRREVRSASSPRRI